MTGSNLEIKRGEIWVANLNFTADKVSIQQGIRPIYVCSNNRCNKFSPVITIIPISSKTNKRMITHVDLGMESGLDMPSVALCEQIMSLDKKYLINKLHQCPEHKIQLINRAVDIQLERSCSDYVGIEKQYFDNVKARSMAQSITELEKFIINNNLYDSKEIMNSIQIQIDNLEDYCSKYNKNINMFYKSFIPCGGVKKYA